MNDGVKDSLKRGAGLTKYSKGRNEGDNGSNSGDQSGPMNQDDDKRKPPVNDPQNSPSGQDEPEVFNFPLKINPLTILLLILFGMYVSYIHNAHRPVETVPYSTFKQEIRDGKVADVTIQGEKIYGHYVSGTIAEEPLGDELKSDRYNFRTTLPPLEDHDLIPLLEEHNVKLNIKSSQSSIWVTMLVGIAPWLLLLAFFFYSNRAIKSRFGEGGFTGFGKSTARLHHEEDIDVRFDDVAGLEHAKGDLIEIIDYLKRPEKYRRLGAKIPKGVLLMGPPGTGKTLVAKATAGEAGVPFFSITGSEFVEMFVGVGAARVRDMFQEARKVAPALIFVDEIDAVGRTRGAGLGGGNDEREQTLNQILAEMDGFKAGEPVVVLAATNRPDVLDPALMRPGRFDRKIILELPQRKARLALLEVHSRKAPLADDVDLASIAAETVGFSGADIANLVNEAALHAARADQELITKADFVFARDKVVLGAERDELLNEKEKQRVAYHEAGHALLAFYLPYADALKRVTIIPHGRALGVTEQLPSEDQLNYSQHYLEDRLAIMLGGYCAEKLIFDEVSSGAANDLKQATQLARHMVAQWGMNEDLGPVSFDGTEEHPFLGREMALPREISEKTAERIDVEITKLIKLSQQRAQELLAKKRDKLESLSKHLVEDESLDEHQIKEVLG